MFRCRKEKSKAVSRKETCKSTEVQKQSICTTLLPFSGYFLSVTDYSNFNHLINLLHVTLYSLNLQCFSRRLTTKQYAVVDIEWFWWFGFSSFLEAAVPQSCWENVTSVFLWNNLTGWNPFSCFSSYRSIFNPDEWQTKTCCVGRFLFFFFKSN